MLDVYAVTYHIMRLWEHVECDIISKIYDNMVTYHNVMGEHVLNPLHVETLYKILKLYKVLHVQVQNISLSHVQFSKCINYSQK